MKGILIVNHYLNSDKFTSLNKWVLESAKKYNIDMKIFTNREVMLLSEDEIKSQCDFILFWDKDIMLAKRLENMNIRVINSSDSILNCDDKALTYLKLYNSGIQMPKTIIAPMTYDNIGYSDSGFLKEAADILSFPLIIKERFGSFGYQVYKADNYEELHRISYEKWNNKLIFQQYIKETEGKDIRINVVGGKVVAAMKRVAKENDFRANITNGGTMSKYTPTDKDCEIAIKASEILGLDFCGVDLLFGAEDNERYLCEVNSNAHFINIFNCTGVNVADKIFEYIRGNV
ncbi:MAG: RimK family alpha-L-glutamate ligase [Lachnospiraceae bacterium]|nr:RimK family alpha-L-glutamate ligase [Lachnospiraceae bacterium]